MNSVAVHSMEVGLPLAVGLLWTRVDLKFGATFVGRSTRATQSQVGLQNEEGCRFGNDIRPG